MQNKTKQENQIHKLGIRKHKMKRMEFGGKGGLQVSHNEEKQPNEV